MKPGFEDAFSAIQTDMISVCLDYAKHAVEKVYIYGSFEENTLSVDCFFAVGSGVRAKSKLPRGYDTSLDHQRSVLASLMQNMEDLIAACKEFEADMPTEVKLVYDVKINSVDARYQYDPVYSPLGLTAYEMSEQWIAEVGSVSNSA